MSGITEVPDSSSKFMDAEFMANNKEVSEQWVSIRELYPDSAGSPLLPETFSREQFAQGKHYECFMLSALSALVRHPEVIRNCFVTKKVRQDGRYTFQFFRGKEWVKVEIDDRIALEDDEVLYCQSPTEHWWPLLLEKAYAKFYTGYDYLEGCSLQETYHDLTSRPVLNIPLQAKLAKSAGINIDDGPYFLKVGDQIRKGEFVASCLTENMDELEEIGLQTEQQYAILDIFSLTGSSVISDLVVHLHNPFEDDVYTGPLNSKDKMWTNKQRTQYPVDENKSVFIPFPNFKKLISSLQLCFMSNVDEKTTYFSDMWKGETAGGNPTFVTWRKNPMFLVKNTSAKENRLIISIIQKDQRSTTPPESGTSYAQCGLVITRNNSPNPIPTFYVTGNNNKPVFKSLFLNSREVSNAVTIPPQSSCYIVPSTMAQNVEAEFLLALNYFKNENYSDLTVEKLEINSINWNTQATKKVQLSEKEKDRVDFYVDCETNIHIILRQDVGNLGKQGDAMTESYMGMYIYDDTDRRIGGVHAATNFRETGIVHHLTRSGRYAVSLTCPRSKIEVPCTITICGLHEANARIVDAPEDAGMFDDEDVIDEGNDVEEENPIDWTPINLPASTVTELADNSMPFEDKRFYTTNRGASNEAWIHIGDLYPEGKNVPLLPDKLSRDQFEQGENYECCAITAFAALVDKHPDVIRNCFVTKNPRKDGRYTFQFHRYGQWVKVEIDDRIPCIDGQTAYCRSPTHNWWPLLLEKAYAKFYTLYQNLENCTQQEVFHDFTGRPILTIPTDPVVASQSLYYVDEPHFWYELQGNVSTCVLTAVASGNNGAEEMGLLEDQYYAILDIIPTSSDRENCDLSAFFIKMYNPFEESPYTGPMHAGDESWNPSLKAELGADERNVFIMTANVFLQVFKSIQQGIIGVFPDPGWHFNSEWGEGTNGGNPTLISWRENPLFVFRNQSKENLNIVVMSRQPDQRHMLHTLPDGYLEYFRKGCTVAQAVPTSVAIPTYLVTHDNHKLIHKGLFASSREACDTVTIPADSLCYVVASCLGPEKSKFIFSYWFSSSKDVSKIKVYRYKPDVCRSAPAETALLLENRSKERVDFLVDTGTPIHILLTQQTPSSPNANGNIMTSNFLSMYLFDSDNKLVKGLPGAMCFREISIVEKLAAPGRYALLVTCPKANGSVPCDVNIVGTEAAHVRITETPENQGDLNVVDLSFLDQEPYGIPITELPLSTDSIFQQKLEELQRLLKDPNADPAEIERPKKELNDRARELAAQLIGNERPIYLKGRDLDTLNPLLDADEEYMQNEMERYKLKQDPRTLYKVPAKEEQLRSLADTIMEKTVASKLDFIDPEPEGIPVADIPLREDKKFSELMKKRLPLLASAAGNAAEISSLEMAMNDRAHDMAKEMHEAERVYLDKEPNHIPLRLLPLNSDDIFSEKEDDLRALKRDNTDAAAVKHTQDVLQDRAYELAKNLKTIERDLFLASTFAGIPAEDLLLDEDPEFHACEIERLEERQNDSPDLEKIRRLEGKMNDRAEQLAKARVASGRGFLAESGLDLNILNDLLDKNPDFRKKEAQLRELMKDPAQNAAAIEALKQEMIADAQKILQTYKDKQRKSFLKPEYEGRATNCIPLDDNKDYVDTENKLFAATSQASAKDEEMKPLIESLNNKAAELAHAMNVKDRSDYLDKSYGGVLTTTLPLDTDKIFNDNEIKRARMVCKGEDTSKVEDELRNRAEELAKQEVQNDRGYLNPIQSGVPLALVPLDDNEDFVKAELERYSLKRTALDPNSVKIKEKELNGLAEKVAKHMKETQRATFMDDSYDGIPRAALPLDSDAEFSKAEIDRLQALQDGKPSTVSDLEAQMIKRAKALAKSQKEGDRGFIYNVGLPLSNNALDKVLDNDLSFREMEAKLRELKKNPGANADAIKNLQAEMQKQARKAVGEYLDEERKGYLHSHYCGRPVETIPLNDDPEFRGVEKQYHDLKNSGVRDGDKKLKDLEDLMHKRATELAKAMNEKDRKDILGEKVRGVPVTALPLDDDEHFTNLETQRAKIAEDPTKADEKKKLEEAIRQRADEIAKAKISADRGFLDGAPEGIPLKHLQLDDNPEFRDKEEQRASLLADNANGKNNKAISALEDNMKDHSRSLAKGVKAKHIKDCVDPEIRGIPSDILKLAEDPECTNIIAKRAEVMSNGDDSEAENLASNLNERAKQLMDARIDSLRGNLKQEHFGIPLSDVKLDSDKKFKDLEREAASLFNDREKNKSKLKDLFDEMNKQAAVLAEAQLWDERASYLEPNPESRDLRDLPLNDNAEFLSLEKDRRAALKSGDSEAVENLETKLNDLASEMARKMNADERASYLGSAVRGMPLPALGLDDDPDFRNLERQRQENKRNRGLGNDDVEEALRSRAAALAADKLKNDRAFLDQKPEGVPLRQVPIDDDSTFKQLEEKRAKVRSQGGSTTDVRALEDKMNERARQLAAKVKEATRGDLNQNPLSIPLSELPLDEDSTFTDLEENYRDAKNASENGKEKELLNELNARAEELAKEVHDKTRSSLNQNPEGIPLSELPLDKDNQFLGLESEARSLKSRRPSSAGLKRLNAELDKRASELAHAARKEYLDPAPEGIPLELLNLGKNTAFLAKESDRRQALASAPEKVEDLNKELNQMAREIARDQMMGDRDFLDQNPEGVPIDVLQLDTDPRFHELELERAKAKGDPSGKNSSKIKGLEESLNDRLHQLAKEQKKEDLRGLDQAPRGIPVESLNPHNDAEFSQMVDKIRKLKKDPEANAVAIQSLQVDMNLRCQDLAKNMLMSDRAYLDQNPEGVPLSILNIDEDPKFLDLEAQRANLKSVDPKRNASSIKGLEEQLNARAHELALQRKAEELEGINATPRDLPLESLKPYEDSEFSALINELRELPTLDSGNKDVMAIKSRMNARVEEMADQRLTGDRGYLVANPRGVPLEVLPLDTDPTFHKDEVKRAVLKADNARRNADKIKELEDQLNVRALELADARREKDLEGIEKKPHGVPLEVVDPHSDTKFAEMVNQRRALEANSDGGSQLPALVDIMNARALELASTMVKGDRSYLDKNPEGVPLEQLPLDSDETFKTLEAKRAVLKAKDGRKSNPEVRDVEAQLNDRAHELARLQKEEDLDGLEKKPLGIPVEVLKPHENKEFSTLAEALRSLKKDGDEEKIQAQKDKMNQCLNDMAKAQLDRSYLDKAPEGVELKDIPLDSDKSFKNMESERAILKLTDPHRNANKIKSLEQSLNTRAHDCAKMVKEDDISGVDEAPFGVPKESLNLHNDLSAIKLIQQRREAKKDPNCNPRDVADLDEAINNRAHEVAQTLTSGDRESYLDPKPLGIPLAHLVLDSDQTFKDLEVERAKLKVSDPKANASQIHATEKLLNDRTKTLAKRVMEDDLKPFQSEYNGIPVNELKPHADNIFAKAAYNRRQNKIVPEPYLDDDELEQVMDKRLRDLANEKKEGELYFLKKDPLGVPLDQIPFLSDAEFQSLRSQREKLMSNDAFANREAIKKLEDDLNDRVEQMAADVLHYDFANVNQKPFDIPLDLLQPREDATVAELVTELRRTKMTPALASRAGKLEQQIDDRVHVLAKEALEDGRSQYLDANPEGVSLSLLPLNTNEEYHKLDAKRAILKLEDELENNEAIKSLQEELNNWAHDLALAQKEEDLEGVDKTPLGVPIALLKPHSDPRMSTMIDEIRVLKRDPIKYADKIRSQQSSMNDRVYEMAKDLLEGDRGYLGKEILGVPVSELPLDSDPTFHSLEIQRAAEKTKNPKNAKALEGELYAAAEDLARQQLQNDLEGLNQTPSGVPINLLRCHDDQKFASHLPELRRLAKDPSRNATKLKALRDKLNDRNIELAETFLNDDRNRYLDPEPAGIPWNLLPLSSNEDFKSMEARKLKVQDTEGVNSERVKALEEELNNLARQIALDQIKKDRDYLDQTPEGVPISILPLDTDSVFRDLEVKRATAKSKNPSSQEIEKLEEQLNNRAHELARLQIEEDLKGLNQSPRGIPVRSLNPHGDPIFAQMVEDLRSLKSHSSGGVEEQQAKMDDRLDQLAENALTNDRAYLPTKIEGIPTSRLPLDTDASFHTMEVERAQLKLQDPQKNASKIKELEDELLQRAKQLAKEVKQNDLNGLNQAPRGIPLEILNLHQDPKCASLLEEKSNAVKSRSIDPQPLTSNLNSIAEQMADGMLKGDRDYLDREPEGIPLKELNLDEDESFHSMEVERAIQKATNPVKNASTILDLEEQLNSRAHQLANGVLQKDRNYLTPNPLGVSLDVLPLDTDNKFHSMEVERARQKRKGGVESRVAELEENLNKRAEELAKRQLEEDLQGLDKDPEGYPIAFLNPHSDAEFSAAVPNLREAKRSGATSEVKRLQAQLNELCHEIAKKKILQDRADLDQRPDGVPLDLLPINTDGQFKTLERDLRNQKASAKSDPSASTKVALQELLERMNKRSKELAKDLRLKNRAYLDAEPEGVPLDDVPLDEDETFKNLEVERLRLLAAAASGSSSRKAEIAELEEKLNSRARELARQLKMDGRGFLNEKSHGLPKEYIALDKDKDFLRLERDLRRVSKHPERNAGYSVEDVKEKLQQRADEIAEQQLKGDRSRYLDVQPEGVDLTDIPVDEDPTFIDLELRRAIAISTEEPSSTIENLEKQLNERTHELARKVVESDREFLPKEIKNIPIEDLPLDEDDKFKKLERRRRQHKRACKMDDVLDDEEQLRQRASEIAESVIDQDLAPLKKCYRGVPTKELNLHADEKFRDLASKRRRKRGQGRVKAVDMVAIEDDMDKRACEIADDLINEERAFLDQEPEGMYIMDVPLDDDTTFLQLEAEYRRRSKDPRVANLNKDVLRELCNEMNQRSHTLARNEFNKRREFMDPEPEGVALIDLGLDEDPEFKEAEIALYRNERGGSPNLHVSAENKEKMNKRARELARLVLASDRDFLDPEPEGVQLAELPLDSDQLFGDLARERRRRKKNLQRGAGEEKVKAVETQMNDRCHELAKEFLAAERAFLENDPEGVPVEDLPLNSDPGFRALEKERLKLKRDPAIAPSAVKGIEATLNDRAKQVARNMLSKERAFLDKEPLGVPLEDLPLNFDQKLNPVERKRRALRKDPKRNQESIRDCEDQMADRVNEIAAEFIQKERAFMDQEPEGVPLRYLPLGSDKEFRDLERQRRGLVVNPEGNAKSIAEIEDRMNNRGHALAKELVEKGRSFLDPEPLGVPITDVPLNGDEQFRKMEEQRRSLKQDPRNNTTVKALEERLNDRSYELAQNLLDTERAFMDQKPLGIPLADLPLNQDLRMREIERTRRLLRKDNSTGKHNADVDVLEDGMRTRSVELAKRAFEEERGFLIPDPCGVPLSDLPLFEDNEFHSKELERLNLRKKKQSSEKMRGLEMDLNARAEELAKEFIRKERQYLDQEPEGIPLERLPLDKDAVFHSMELQRRDLVREQGNPDRIADLEYRLNERAHELAQEIRGWQDQEFHDANCHVAPLWPRIGELFPEGRYDPIIPDEASTGDAFSSPGDLGYLAPFIAALGRHPVLLKRLLVTEGHPVNAPYTFLFFDPNSNPVYVDIDDRVPCNDKREPMFVQSPNRYWYPLLLEKAYAKFVGGYEKLDNCTPHETLRDLTGRPVTHTPFDAKLAEAANIGDSNTVGFWREVAEDMSRGDLILCMSNATTSAENIHPQCSYALLGLVDTNPSSKNLSDMVAKLHNPYCFYEPFYCGPLEKNDPNWTEDLRRACRFDATRDDILYLPLPVLLRNFSSLQRCHINCGDRLTASGTWDENSAGGNPKFTSFRNNPIYLVENKSTRPTTILAEVRHSAPTFTDPDGLNHYPQTGIALMQPVVTSIPPTPLITNSTHRFLQKGMMLDSREVCAIMEIPASSTCYLIPYTIKSMQFGSFSLSVYPGIAKVTLTPLHFAGLSREPTTTKVKVVPGDEGKRVDFTVSESAAVHILLHQDKVSDQKSIRKGDAIGEDDLIFSVFNEQGIRCGSSGDATNAREHSFAFKAPQPGRYSLLITVPNNARTGDAPLTLSIYTPKKVTVKFVPPPAGARPLQQARLPTLGNTAAAKSRSKGRRASSAGKVTDDGRAVLPPISRNKNQNAKRRSVSQGMKRGGTESARF